MRIPPIPFREIMAAYDAYKLALRQRGMEAPAVGEFAREVFPRVIALMARELRAAALDPDLAAALMARALHPHPPKGGQH